MIHWISWPNYTLEKLSDCMVRQFPLFQTEIPGLTHGFGPVYRMPLALNCTSVFHPQTDDQSERTIQTLEDMLRACVMEFRGGWVTGRKRGV